MTGSPPQFPVWLRALTRPAPPDIVKSSAPSRLNHGMIYRLHSLPKEEMLRMLDQAASVGFRVMLVRLKSDLPSRLVDAVALSAKHACVDIRTCRISSTTVVT